LADQPPHREEGEEGKKERRKNHYGKDNTHSSWRVAFGKGTKEKRFT
jgi:hypothetical protein